MNREFLDLYNTELQLLNEHARQFAEEYPGIAERLGGILEDRVDPLIGGLLEGAAFLAARVQLKLKHEFPEFTENLLEQLVPHYLAPTPSMMLVKANPVFGDPALREGAAIARGSYLDASFRQLDRQIACRYRLCGDITIWPFELVAAEYHSSPAPLQALGVSVGGEVLSGLRLSLTHRSTARSEDEPSEADARKKPELLIAGCRTSQLPLYFVGAEADSVALYEQLFAHCRGIYFRHLDQFGNPVVFEAPLECLQQIGFDSDDGLFTRDHRVLEIYAHYLGGRDKVPVRPLYSASLHDTPAASDLCFSIRRLPRRRTVEEKRSGTSSDYTGTDMFISLSEFGGIDDQDAIAELSVRALCSNRHLTEHLPIGVGGADFRLIDNYTLDLVCVAGPTSPREPVIRQLRSRSETAHTGTVTWRLVNLLSTNHLGLVERGAGRNAEAVRETLSIFAEMADSATERRIRGVRHVDSRPIVRRIRQRSGIGVARGIEITVTIDEKAFEGTGAFLLGAVLDRFFAEYSGFNNFTQTVIRSVDRGEIIRWPPRMGMRRPL